MSEFQFVTFTYVMSYQRRWRFVHYNLGTYVQLLSTMKIEANFTKLLANIYMRPTLIYRIGFCKCCAG